MKIHVLSTSYKKYKGDFETPFIHALNKELSKNNDITVITSHGKDTKDFEIIDGIKIYRFQYFFPKRFQQLTYTGGMLESFKGSMVSKIQIPLFMFSFIFKSIMKCRNADVIHAHWTPAGFVAIILKKIYKKPMVLTLHGADMRNIPKSLNRFILKNVDAITSAHEELLDLAKGLGIENTIKIRNMIDFDRFDTIKDKKTAKDNVTLIGRLVDMKDPITLIKAIPYVIKKNKNIKFILTGDGPLMSEVKILAKKLNIEKYIDITGPRSDTEKIFEKTRIFLAISPLENCFSTTIIEAMYSGIPCIITKAGYTEKFFRHKHNAYLIEPKDEKGLAEAILSLYDNKNLRNELIKNGKLFLEQEGFDKKTILGKFNSVYKNLLLQRT